MYVSKRKNSMNDFTYFPKRRKILAKNNVINPTQEDDEEEDGEGQQPPLPQPQLETKQSCMIYRNNNHLYFRADVTTACVSKLIKLINEANEEFTVMAATIHNAKLEPKPLYLHITSIGGSMFAGFMAMDAIENSRIPIYTIVEGTACSAATTMSLAGKIKLMTKNSYYMIHQLSTTLSGSFRELADCQRNNEEFMDKLKKIYMEKSKGTIKGKKLDEVLSHDVYWSYETCKRYNLIDGLYSEEQLKVCDDPNVNIIM